MRSLILFGCLAMAGFALSVHGGTARADVLTLPDALERVRREHPEVLRARAAMMQARFRVGVALADYLPSSARPPVTLPARKDEPAAPPEIETDPEPTRIDPDP